MVSRTFSRFLDKRPTPNDITIWHLSRKLKRLDKRIRRPNAKPSDYAQRDRVAAQLDDAKKFLG